MSSTLDNQIRINLPSAIRELLTAVRGRVRRYSVLSGVLFLMIAAALSFWVTYGLDSGWFAIQRLELPVGLRFLMLVIMAAAAAWLILGRVLRPLIRRHRDREIAVLLERRFPEFQDRLVTTVECSDGYPGEGPVVGAMLSRTAEDAGAFASTVNTQDVFELRQLKGQGWAAGLLGLSILGYGLFQPGSLQRWWSAFVQCEETYHERTTTLEFRAVAQPGDRRQSFQSSEAEGGAPFYLHPRGSDFELEMTVPTGKSPAGREWVVPERVRVDLIREDGTRSRTYVSASSERRFRFVVTRLQETISLEILAGDFRTSVPLEIRSVEPPTVTSLQADCVYPAYTGWNRRRQRNVTVLGSELSLPIGTRFDLVAASNKPLQSARLVGDLFEVTGDRESCQVIPREGFQVTAQPTAPLVSADGLAVSAEFQLVLEPADTPLAVPAEADTATTPQQADDSALCITSNSTLRFFLHDTDNIISLSPQTVRIRGVADKPPVIATRSVGVANAITRRAVIPFAGSIQDDYGVAKARFEFIVDDGTTWRVREFQTPLVSGAIEYELLSDEAGRPERFDVLPLELSEGQTLSISVTATDACTEPAPQTSRAEPVVFRVVSNEELLSLLYTRELNMRRRFEEVIRRLEQIRDDVQFHEAAAARLASGEAADTVSQDRIALTDCARRSGDSLRVQSNELASIRVGFEEVIEQLINNQIPPKQLASDMRNRIVTPLQKILDVQMKDADNTVSEFRVAASRGEDCSGLVARSVTDIEAAIVGLRGILENVRDMAEFHEVLSDLNAILKDQEKIQKETNAEQIKRLGFD
ncbi:MAG: hypothetical protein NXI04_08725 [Planctomycetaceae bacterium]|nr:hypothetical protein [Planctomycetaceae bacterium]